MSEHGMTLPQIRRLEAVSFRSFPATSTHYDGTWAVRLTAGHPAKRLNSVTPLDPQDHSRIDQRLEMARHRFESFGRPFVFRHSPLAPTVLETMFQERGWQRFDESIVMLAPLAAMELDDVVDQIPIQDTGLWVDGFLQLSKEERSSKPGLVEVISAIQPECGLFLREDEKKAVAAVRCVHDNDLAGIFDLVTGEAFRREGHGRAIMESALKWARSRGARSAWLQVVATNHAAVELYGAMGFSEVYRYAYFSPVEDALA